MSNSLNLVERGYSREVSWLQRRLKAGAVHLLASLMVAGAVLAVALLCWYPGPLNKISGVGKILFLLFAIDVVLGPLLTVVVYDKKKTKLWLDLSCIAALQLCALMYGLHVVEFGRPHFLVFVKDRFEVVSKADLHPADLAEASGWEPARVSWFGPKIVAAEMPVSVEERQGILMESLFGGRDLQHLPRQYRSYSEHASLATAKAAALSKLRSLNPKATRDLQAAIDELDLPEQSLGFLPVKGPKGDAALLVDVSSGRALRIVDLRPWL